MKRTPVQMIEFMLEGDGQKAFAPISQVFLRVW